MNQPRARVAVFTLEFWFPGQPALSDFRAQITLGDISDFDFSSIQLILIMNAGNIVGMSVGPRVPRGGGRNNPSDRAYYFRVRNPIRERKTHEQ